MESPKEILGTLIRSKVTNECEEIRKLWYEGGARRTVKYYKENASI